MTDIVDFTRIQETSDGDMEFESELIEMYLEDAKEHTGKIVELISSGDVENLKSAAHTLKGSSANIGASGVQAVAAVIERSASDGDLPPSSEAENLNSVMAETEIVFREYLANHT